MPVNKRTRLATGLIVAVGLGSAANALWMLGAPQLWFEHLPAAVTDFGPYNVHFIRDVGIAYLSIAVALLWGAWNSAARPPMTLLGAVFFGGHAAIHIFDTARGHVGQWHWLLDLPTTYLPVLALIAAILLSRGDTCKAAGSNSTATSRQVISPSTASKPKEKSA
jgi:hypothetical protein